MLLAAALAGCGNIPYEEPKGDTASFTVVNQASTPAKVVTYLSGAECRDQRVLPNVPGNQELTFKIPGGAGEFSFVVETREGGMYCNLPLSFFPEKNGSYRAIFRIAEGGRSCVMRVIGANGTQHPEFFRKTFRSALTAAGPWCHPL